MVTAMSALFYTVIAVGVVVGVILIGWKLFQLAHRKAGEEPGQAPAEERRGDWPWSDRS